MRPSEAEVRVHTLKTIDTVWDAVERGEKRFEVRKNDRFFQRGDIVRLSKVDRDGYYITPPGKMFGTIDLDFKIGWTLQGGQFGIEPGYIVFQLEPCEAMS
ncbi:MAG: DUF3850 domain-containing protein [Rhizobiales bacterium]|nr:DUF3850 domain-containing protein [Hyphomicrobiales bacterium]